ncbi:MAG TPA: SPW repeat protein [Gemmatimonadaceae bacterium]|jgi:hypothetical protein
MARVAQPLPSRRHFHADPLKYASGLAALVGVYMQLATWMQDLDIGNQLNGVVLGGVATILGTARYCRAAGPWAGWVVSLIGVWFILSPWLYRYAGEAWMWNSIVVGLAMVMLGVWSASAPTHRRRT